ncbi:4-hydroxythreonine-4-phosphate dehydrogenase PdxA [Halobacteriales archaeon QS_4_62_28]|nr:MAG: 4-hydroxythreonine-4-phosphate dehydrogenase PdxA [Halobacteriales archaeon QS_4_62_28]
MSTQKPIVAVTMGDPAGIGSEIIIKAYPDLREHARVVVFGDAAVLKSSIDVCDSPLTVRRVGESFEFGAPEEIPVLDFGLIDDVEYGELHEEYGEASLAYIQRAIEFAKAGDIDAIATAPINKQATRMAGSDFAGHTGMLASHTNTENYAMLLIEDQLRVSHVSTHISLREAVEQVTSDNVLATIEVTASALEGLGVADPTIAAAGLNPHASDGGLLGNEDAEEIKPAVEGAVENGIDVVGPESPDIVFKQAAGGQYDAVVAMYHDQGHIPVKMLGALSDRTVSGVNMTIGLPIVRTSVDHGTAFDIAGQGIASEASLIDAVETAARVATAD